MAAKRSSRKRSTSKKKVYKATGKGRTIKKSASQAGRSKTSADRRQKALPPGKRVSATGRVYYERRANRSDKDRRKKL